MEGSCRDRDVKSHQKMGEKNLKKNFFFKQEKTKRKTSQKANVKVEICRGNKQCDLLGKKKMFLGS